MTRSSFIENSILIVEDDIEIRETLCEFLESQDFTVVMAEHGGAALDHLQKNLQPALILLDLMMPVMNGWDFAREISNFPQWNKIPILVMTAIPDKVIGIKAESVLRKPFDLHNMLPLISRFVAGPRTL